MQSLEEAKNLLMKLRSDADATIGDPYFHPVAVILGANFDVRGFAFGNEFQGVRNKIVEHLPNGGWMGRDAAKVSLNVDLGFLLLDFLFDGSQHVAQSRIQFNRRELEVARIEAAV